MAAYTQTDLDEALRRLVDSLARLTKAIEKYGEHRLPGYLRLHMIAVQADITHARTIIEESKQWLGMTGTS